jgi:hypothetical protein
MSNVSDFLAPRVGIRFPGGCDDCNAWQEMRLHHGIWVITISHDDTCPTWRQIQRRRQATT